MAEYLIQSETLDDIADAINAKTGGSSAMTPAEMVTAIGSISGGGGGLEYETGIVEALTERASLTINHSLNSVKVIGFVVPIAGEVYASESTSTNVAGYQTIQEVFCNVTETVDGAFTLDVSSYNTTIGRTEIDYAQTAAIPILGAQYQTPWSTHSSPDTGMNSASALFKSYVAFTQNRVNVNVGGSRMFMKGKYKYMIIKFG